MRIRPTTDDDDLDAVHEGDDQWFGAALYRDMLAAFAATNPVGAWIAEIDGHPVGHAFANYRDSRTEGEHFGYVWTVPTWRRRGVGAALRAVVLERGRELGFTRCLSAVSDTDPDSVPVARHWGGVEDGYHFESRLDLTTFDDDLVDSLTAKALRAGIEFRWLSTDDEMRELVPFIDARTAETPDAGDHPEPESFELLRVMTAPEDILVATYGGDPVGLTFTAPWPEVEGGVITGLTGVDPQWRGRGVATALKALSAQAMRDRGHTVLLTQNMRGNDHILAANDRLGFVRGPGRYDYVFDL